MFEHLDERSRLVVDLAQQQAHGLDHNYLGTEHLLYGLARSEGIVATLLAERHCAPDDITNEIVTLIGRGRPPDAQLATLGIDLDHVRHRVEATFGTDAITRVRMRNRPRRRRWPGHGWWPGCDEGRPHPSTLLGTGWIGVAPRVKRVLEIAARRSAPELVSPPQLMTAILIEGEGVACQILTRRGVDLAELDTALHVADDGT